MRLIFLILFLVTIAVLVGTLAYHSSVLPEKTKEQEVAVHEEGFSRLENPSAFPEITFTDLYGSPVSIVDFRGKVVLVNFWASWCAPCLEEMPDLVELTKQYAGKDFVVIAISQDIDTQKSKASDKVRKFLQDNGIQLDSYLDPDSKAFDALEISSLPHSYLLDRQGRQVVHVAGSISYHKEKLSDLIDHLLGE